MKVLLVLSLVLEMMLVAYFFVPKNYFSQEKARGVKQGVLVPVEHEPTAREKMADRIRGVMIDCMMFCFLAVNSLAMVIFWRRIQNDQMEAFSSPPRKDPSPKKQHVEDPEDPLE